MPNELIRLPLGERIAAPHWPGKDRRGARSIVSRLMVVSKHVLSPVEGLQPGAYTAASPPRRVETRRQTNSKRAEARSALGRARGAPRTLGSRL
jgi:hypothetical protein